MKNLMVKVHPLSLMEKKYDGDWKDGKENGQGTLTWSNGSKYEGEWKNGKRTGHGTLTNSDGKKYV